ncbi:hypothetical protein [Oceanobacillus kapialis]|uniref:Uncharacterized protein n=1 Tax=Oceanobacillus kapialis TaxID=481353 RepID=A0ABW5PXF8_9BACI
MSSLSVINRQISKTEKAIYSLEEKLRAKRNELELLALGLTHLYDYMEEHKQNGSSNHAPKPPSSICKEQQAELFHSLQLEELPDTHSPIYNEQLVKSIREVKEKIREEKQTLVTLKRNITTYQNELHYLHFERKRKLS